MTGTLKLASIGLIGLTLTGCVAQEKYTASVLEADSLREQLGHANASEREARAMAESYKLQLEKLNGGMGAVGTLSAQNAALNQQLKDLQDRYNDLAQKSGTVNVLPTPLSNALEQLAAAHPELMEFDSARGILRFKSDVTFASGQATLTGAGRGVVTQFAEILNSQAQGFEFLVVGHTDDVRVSNPATIRAGHKDNWYLSSHRAISVEEALIANNVAPSRLGVTGYADQRPIAPNTTEAGKARNRRVEVVILPTNAGRMTNSSGTSARSAVPANANKP